MRLFYAEKPVKRKVYIVKGKRILLLFIFLTVALLILFIYNTCFSSVIQEKAKVKANYVAVHAINTAVSEKIKSADITYTDFAEISRKEDGSVSSITMNSLALNSFKTDITDRILEQVTAYGRETISISPIVFMGYKTFSFLPKIPIVVIPVEILSADFVSSFKAQGINQTKHEINLVVEIDVKLLLPVGSHNFKVKTTVPLVQTIIVGAVPDTYTNVEGVSGTASDTILNLAP